MTSVSPIVAFKVMTVLSRVMKSKSDFRKSKANRRIFTALLRYRLAIFLVNFFSFKLERHNQLITA